MSKEIEKLKKIKEKSANSLIAFLSAYCSEEWIFLLEDFLKVTSFKKGERVFTEGDEVTGVYFLNDGMVKIASFFDKTNERILRLANKGSLVGHRGLFSDYYPISAIALSNIEVTFIPMDIFIKLIRTNPNFSLFLIEFISGELRKTEDQMKRMIHGEVITRIAVIICMLIDAFGYDPKEKFRLCYTLSRKDIANIAGTTYESVIRNLTQLEINKVIEMDGKNFIIRSEDRIRVIAGFKV